MERRLVPAIVILLLAGLLWWTRRTPPSPLHPVESDVRACTENLRAIHAGLVALRDREGALPAARGVGFLAELLASGIWEDSPENRARLTCPGPGARPVPPGTDLATADGLDATCSAYAVRDLAAHPREKYPAGGPEQWAVVACDNALGENHPGALNVLYSDGSVRTFLREQLVAQGRLPSDAATIPLGPDSPLEELRVFLAD